MNVLRHWTVGDREHLAVVMLGAFEVPDRGELVRRITENYVPARHYRGAVDALRKIDALLEADMPRGPFMVRLEEIVADALAIASSGGQ